MKWIDDNWKRLVGEDLAWITKVSLHGHYYGMRDLAIEILSSDQGYYFCPFAFGEGICEGFFSKLRFINKAIAADYATGKGNMNSQQHRKVVKYKRRTETEGKDNDVEHYFYFSYV